jgi:hypothetical protein
MNSVPFLVLLTVLQQSPGGEGFTSQESTDAPSYSDGGSGGSSTFYHLAFEAGPLSFPSGTQGGGQDLFAQAVPIARLEVGDGFALELGAPLRLRLLDKPPEQVADDYSAHLRRQDWDTPSDFGQILRELSIHREDGRFSLYAGPFTAFTLGEGHLVERYTNQLSPDYHPAGALMTLNVGPTRVQVAASDVLSTRLFASELRLDIGRLASTNEQRFNRYFAVAAVAHDFGRVGEVSTDSITAAVVGANAALYKADSGKLDIFAMAGAGSRVDVGAPDIGGFLGFAVRGETESMEISGRLEGRYQGGSFRFGLFGPSYELARFSATGLSEPPLSEERVDKDMSGYAELKLNMGSDDLEEKSITASAAGEYFANGRVDADLALSFRLPGGRAVSTARVILTGLGAQPRYSAQAELRQRLMPWLYIWGTVGTIHFPQLDGSLAHGFTAGAGAGVELNR